MKSKKYLYLSVLSFSLFFLLSIFIVNGNSIFYDAPIYEKVSQLPFQKLFLFLTHFGDSLFILIGLFFVLFFMKDRRARQFFCSTVFLEMLSNALLKRLFRRARPNVTHLVFASGYSFPSGHAMGATTFYGLVLYFVWKSHLPKALKIFFTVLCVFMVLMICFSRVYLGVHYPSDIVGGFLMGTFLVTASIFLYQTLN